MNPTKPLLLLSAIYCASCIQLPEAERPPSLTLSLTAPAETTYTNAMVSIQVQVQGPPPERVELLLDGQQLTTLEAAPYHFEWDTRNTPEGGHQIHARAHLDGQDFSSGAREIVVDRTPPQVSEQTPSPGAQNVWVRAPIEATFSEPVKASTLTKDSVRLTVHETEALTTLSLSSDGKKLTVTPVKRPVVPNNLQLSLSNAITDLAGNALTSFPGAWNWSLPRSFALGTLSVPAETHPYAPHLLIDRENNPLVSWNERPPSPRDPFTIHTYHLSNNEWVPVGNPLASRITYENLTWHPHIVQLDSSNNPIIAWSQADETSPIGIHHLNITHWSGTAWTNIAIPPESNPDIFNIIEDGTGFVIRLDTKDTPTLAWTSGNSNLRVWRKTANTWLELASALNTEPILQPDHIQLTLDKTGKPLIAWTEGDILVRRWNGSSWVSQGNPIGELPGGTIAQPESMLLDGMDSPIIAWTETDPRGPSTRLVVSRLEGTTWRTLGTPLDTSSGTEALISSAGLLLDNTGNLLIAWMGPARPQHPSDHQINLRRWSGTNWVEIGSPLPVAVYIRPFELRTMSCAIDGAGRPYLAWPGKLLDPPSEPGVQIHRYNY
jgi:hypothetical protein